MPPIDLNVVETFARFTALILLFGIVLFLVWLVTIIDILKSEFKRDADKIVWFFFVTMVPLIGAFLYFLIGRFQKSESETNFRSTRYRDIGRE